MTTQWDTLRQTCPRLYKNLVSFECGPGWYDILHDLSIKIERILDEFAKTHSEVDGEDNEFIEMFAVQVKEKYGTLRFYMSYEIDEIYNLIEETEALSSQTCESCGAPAKMRGTHRVEVKCDQCFKERK